VTIPAVLYNNPGDVSLPIEGWTGPGIIVGIDGQPGYAEFPTMQTGYAALLQRIVSYIAEGRTTISAIGEVYATDQSWAVSVSELSGIPLETMLDPEDSAQISDLAAAIVYQETGMTLTELGIETGEQI
jgi:hypothetical protein